MASVSRILLSHFSVAIAQIFAALVEKFLKVGSSVVRIRPATALPTQVLEKQSHFGKYSPAQINAMVPVLGRRQHKFGFGEVTRIEIDRPLLFPLAKRFEFIFPAIRLVL